jgi:EmrB/QacA subfamily drug resistance transporter
MGAFLSNLSAGMLNVALIDVGKEYNVSIGTVQWVITIYLLTIAICLPIMGRLGDLRGKRTIHNAGFMFFLIGTLCCALAPNIVILIVFRIVQGIGAAMFQATNMGLIVSLVPVENRGRALGVVSVFVAAGTIIGPSIGGIVVQWMTWKAIFWILVGMAAFIWILAQIVLPKDGPSSRVPIDGVGAALFATGLGAMVTALNMSSVWGFISPAILSLWLVFLVCATLFVLWSKSPRWNDKQKIPFIHPGLFVNPTIRLGVSITIITYMAVFATQFVLPIFLRNEMGLEPAIAGGILVGYALSLIVSAPISGHLSDRFGSTMIMTLGLGLMAVALAALSFLSQDSSPAYVLIFILLLGSSMGMINSPNNSMIMGNVDKSLMSFVGSMIALSRNIGLMLGSVLGGTMMSFGAKGGFPGLGKFQIDPALFGYRSVFLAAALCVMLAVAFQLRLVRKELKQRSLSASLRL